MLALHCYSYSVIRDGYEDEQICSRNYELRKAFSRTNVLIFFMVHSHKSGMHGKLHKIFMLCGNSMEKGLWRASACSASLLV